MARQFVASDFREVITHQVGAKSYASGEETVTWSTVVGEDALRVSIRQEKESERVRAGRNEGAESLIVTMRKGATITPASRFIWRGEAYQVAGFPKAIDARRLFFSFPGVRTDAD